jgi:hypothetical protein
MQGNQKAASSNLQQQRWCHTAFTAMADETEWSKHHVLVVCNQQHHTCHLPVTGAGKQHIALPPLHNYRSRSLQHMHALNSQCRGLQSQLKQCKQELRRARKTVKTLELVATAVSSGAATAPAAATASAAAAGSAVNVTMQTTADEQQQQRAVPVVLPGSQHVLTVQQQGGSLMYMTAGVSDTTCRAQHLQLPHVSNASCLFCACGVMYRCGCCRPHRQCPAALRLMIAALQEDCRSMDYHEREPG